MQKIYQFLMEFLGSWDWKSDQTQRTHYGYDGPWDRKDPFGGCVPWFVMYSVDFMVFEYEIFL